MTRNAAIKNGRTLFSSGRFFDHLSRWVAADTGSRSKDRKPELLGYLENFIIPYAQSIGCTCRIVENPMEPCAPFLIAKRVEDTSLPTVLIYGHGDTVPRMDGKWKKGLDPLTLTRGKDEDGKEIWYGRGTADNKGQHCVNLSAAESVLKARGSLGFNLTLLIETGEEAGSPGLHQICEQEKDALSADVLIASDGPRIEPDIPTIFGGSRAVFNFDLSLKLRKGGHHSGNWGGLLANPGIILSHAIASLVDARGKILVDALRPPALPKSVRRAIDELTVTGKGGPEIDPHWGEPGLSAAHKVYGWNTLDVLAFECGTPSQPVNAIPPDAWARLHIRFTSDMDPAAFIPAIREHLDNAGFHQIEITEVENNYGMATRMSPDNPWVTYTRTSFERTLADSNCKDLPVTFLPNLGGTLPNDAFSHILGLPTIWVPHSYGGCSQHAPNEHVRADIMAQSIELMTGLFWDLGETGAPITP